MKDVKLSQKLTEAGLMIAMATILSFIKVVELPFGGSITLATFLPMIILSYRHGFLWGLLSGFVYSIIQMLFGLNNLSYATSFWAVIAIIMLDYVIAFSSVAAGGWFRKMSSARLAFVLASLTCCAIRFVSHTISGCTVWAGVSVPTASAFVYSLIYNAAYMIPETVITTVSALYIATALDFSQPSLTHAKRDKLPIKRRVISAIAGIVSLAGIITAAAFLFPSLQNEDGFDITGIVNVNIVSVIVPLVIAALGVAVFVAVSSDKKGKVHK